MPVPYDHEHEDEVIPFASTNFRGEKQKFGIKTDDRRRHVYIIGKTGMGKTTLIENMVLHDINAGHGIAYIDPHGDTADLLLDFIPPNRINDIVYFNPSDMAFPVGFNILEIKNENEKHLVADGLMGVFKKIWEGVWSPRMEYILLNCVLALLDVPGSTLMGIARILADKEYRKKVVEQIKDPVVRSFWVNEFAGYSDRFASEAIAPVQNKVGQFLSASITRNIVAQTKSTFNIREIMDERKILIANLSKGLVGEDSSRLLGGMLITRLQLAAMERVDMPEKDRQDFYLYVDEFQNFATESFANILSEARKYRLNLVTAHQYIEQLDETVAAAIFGNVGTIISFRVGSQDAETLAKEFAPVFVEEDVINLAKFEIYLKLMIDGVASTPFSASTLPPIAKHMGSREKVLNASRERYAMKREVIEDKVNQWSEYMSAKPKSNKPPAARDGKPKFGGGGDFRTKTQDRSGGDSRAKPQSGGGDFRTKPKSPTPPTSKDGTFSGKVRIAKEEKEEKKTESPAKQRTEDMARNSGSGNEQEGSRRGEPRGVKTERGSEEQVPQKHNSVQRNPDSDAKESPLSPQKDVLKEESVHKKSVEEKIEKKTVEIHEKKPEPPKLKPLPKLNTEAPASPSHQRPKNKKKKNRPYLPPPPKDGTFSGKVRIVEEDKSPNVVLKDDKQKPPSSAKPAQQMPKPRQEPDIQVPPDMDKEPKKLNPGETISFE